MMVIDANNDMLIGKLADIAIEAGAVILNIYRNMKPEDATIKGDGSPVTKADALAEEIILSRLAEEHPGIAIVAEESVAAGRVPETEGRPFFLVDPLDGTKEFLTRNGDFTVNIALIESGRPVLGVVYAPAIGEIYTGYEGRAARAALVDDGLLGPWRDIAVRPRPENGFKVIASRSHLSDETKAFIERFPATEFISAGSSLKFCRVAAGQADLYPRLARTMEWDTAAGDAVLRAAGGKVVTMDGVSMLYGKRNQAHDTDFANGWFVASGGFDALALASKPAIPA